MCPANGCTATCTLEHDPEKVVLKESEPLCVLDVPLHVLAFATFVIIVLGATIIAKILAAKRGCSHQQIYLNHTWNSHL
jgi:hypothetical protein